MTAVIILYVRIMDKVYSDTWRMDGGAHSFAHVTLLMLNSYIDPASLGWLWSLQ